MSNGININNGTSPRNLSYNDGQVATGGADNQAGLYADGYDLFLDGAKIADRGQGNDGLVAKQDGLYYNGIKVGSGDTPTPPDPPTPSQNGLWIPPRQAASELDAFKYRSGNGKRGFIDEYDALMTNSSYPGIIKKYEYAEKQVGTRDIADTSTGTKHTVPVWQGSLVERAAGDYNENGAGGWNHFPLYHYEFVPNNYTKTFYIEACIHGNEHDAPQTILRIMDIICNHCDEAAYARLKPLRDNVRFIVIPVVSPQGHDYSSMNVEWTDWNGTIKTGLVSMNMNRNMDDRQYYTLSSAGTGGNYPMQMPENRHIEFIIKTIGPHNIDYAFDCHDGGDVNNHFWFNYNVDGANAEVMKGLLQDIIDYEEELRENGGKDYRAFSDSLADDKGYVHPKVKDSFGYAQGTNSAYYNGTLGLLGSVSEYIGGYFGYSFSAEQMTRSLRFRANMLIYAYEKINTKGWQINEPTNAKYFHFDYPVAMRRFGLMKDEPGSSADCHHVVTQQDVYDRWNALAANNPGYVVKSNEAIGQNEYGGSVYSYTIGNGNKKVLFIGGALRWGNKAHKETEFGMYLVAEYLCNDYIVNQSAFLRRLRDNYTIVVIPCIDILNGGNEGNVQRKMGLNTYGLGTNAKWRLSSENGKCYSPSSAADVSIFKSWINANRDAIMLLSGGEDPSGYSLEVPQYNQSYMTQIIYPRTQSVPQWLSNYCSHLVDDRDENAPDVIPTVADNNGYGLTFGDYAYDNFEIPTYFINLKPSKKYAERNGDMQSGVTADDYMYHNYETGRRIANIVNFFLMAGGDIGENGGLVDKEVNNEE